MMPLQHYSSAGSSKILVIIRDESDNGLYLDHKATHLAETIFPSVWTCVAIFLQMPSLSDAVKSRLEEPAVVSSLSLIST